MSFCLSLLFNSIGGGFHSPGLASDGLAGHNHTLRDGILVLKQSIYFYLDVALEFNVLLIKC